MVVPILDENVLRNIERQLGMGRVEAMQPMLKIELGTYRIVSLH